MHFFQWGKRKKKIDVCISRDLSATHNSNHRLSGNPLNSSDVYLSKYMCIFLLMTFLTIKKHNIKSL